MRNATKDRSGETVGIVDIGTDAVVDVARRVSKANVVDIIYNRRSQILIFLMKFGIDYRLKRP